MSKHSPATLSTLPSLVLTSLLLPATAGAVAIDNIRLSRIASETTVEIELGCAMRYLSHTPSNKGMEMRVRVSLGMDCVNALRASPSSLNRPRGGRLAFLSEVEFDSTGANQAQILLRFTRPVGFAVRQTANQYLLTVAVDTSVEYASAEPRAVAAASSPRPEASVRRPTAARPSRSIQVSEPRVRDRFAIRLDARAPSDPVDPKTFDSFRSETVYANRIIVNRQTLNEIRIGFFDTEADALNALARLRPVFPNAWITIATPDEQAQAAGRRVQLQESAASAATPLAAPVAAGRNSPTLSAERTAELMTEARSAMLRGDYERSIRVYTRLLEEPAGAHRKEARELLGVARQKNGQVAHAKAEFEAWLMEFSGEPDKRRVQQRLAALIDDGNRARAPGPARVSSQQDVGWEFSGGISQFYLRGVNMSRDDEADVLAQSDLLTQGEFSMSRRGQRFDLLGRANVAYLYDIEDTGTENQARVSYAFFDVTDNDLGLGARLGRQTFHSAGVLGRFDGIHLDYGLWRDLSMTVTAGFPVDSPRYLMDADHYFYGASLQLANVADAWDFSLYTNQQSVDGIADRQAIGADVQYQSDRLNVVGLVDYDASYNVLNTALAIVNWRYSDRLTVHGRYQGGASPYLTTRNAIIGQPVTTVEALLEDYTEGQVRRLARNRTAESRYGSAGLSAELSERWQLNADVVFSEQGATVASGGVAALPETGPQFIYGGYLLGSSLLKAGDSFILGYRHFESRRTDSDTVTLDFRIPIGEGLRINPKLALTLQDRAISTDTDARNLIATPVLRILYRSRKHFRIEFEAGGQWSEEELPPGARIPLSPDDPVESMAYYMHLGYWLDFR